MRSYPSPTDAINSALDDDDTTEIPDGYSANALVLAPPGHNGELAVCRSLLTLFDDVNLLGVAIKHDRSYYRQVWPDSDRSPSRANVVRVGADNPTTSRTEAVSSPRDLTGIGITLTNILKQWSDTGEQTVVCFDSITPLLQYNDENQVYRFLDVTTKRLTQVCAVSHAHIDPNVCDEPTLHQIMNVFDTVVEPTGDASGPDDWTVQRT